MADATSDSLAQLLLRQASERSESPALVLDENVLSYRQLLERVRHTATVLQRQGVQPGERLVLLFVNTLECVQIFLAAAWLQLRVVPVEPDTAGWRLAEIQAELEALWIVGPARTAQTLRAELPHARFLNIDEVAGDQTEVGADIEPIEHRPGEVFVFQYTSGSTGLPRAVMHSQENLITGSLFYRETFQIGLGDRMLVSVPLLHSFGMIGGLVTALLTGAVLQLKERFVPRSLVQSIIETRATILLAVPLMYELMTTGQRSPLAELSALRLCLSTGGELPEKLFRRFHQVFGQEIRQVYGCSEAGMIAAQTPVDPPHTHRSVGHPVHGVELRIVDEERRPLESGEVGMIAVRTPAMFLGYFQKPEKTVEALQDGWYLTCDLGKLDADGYLYLRGRKETFINVGGKKVNPFVVEQVLCSHPSVKEAVVWAEATGRATEEVQAMVVLSHPVTEAGLLAYCRQHLPAYQVPGVIEIGSDLPRSALGKVQRHRPVQRTLDTFTKTETP